MAGTITPLSLSPLAVGTVTPQTGLLVAEIDPVILVKSAKGGWIKASPRALEQKKKLIELYTKLKGAAVDFRFNLSEVYGESNGTRNYSYQTDSQLIKDIRALAAEILGHKEPLPWSEFPAYFRTPSNIPSAPMARVSTRPDNLEFQGDKVDIANRLLEKCGQILNNLSVDAAREEALKNGKKRFAQINKDAILFTIAQPDDSTLENRWQEARETLALDPIKDREYLTDVVRLKCKDRTAYLRETAEIQEKYSAPEKVEKELSLLDRLKSNFTKVETTQTVTPAPVGIRRDGAESFFVQLIDAIAAKDQTADKLINSALFEAAFEDLHAEEQKVVRKELAAAAAAIAAP